jgi:hypothetical protein
MLQKMLINRRIRVKLKRKRGPRDTSEVIKLNIHLIATRESIEDNINQRDIKGKSSLKTKRIK